MLEKKVPINKQICPQCRGRGQVFKNSVFEWGWKACDACKGSGFIEYKAPPWQRK